MKSCRTERTCLKRSKGGLWLPRGWPLTSAYVAYGAHIMYTHSLTFLSVCFRVYALLLFTLVSKSSGTFWWTLGPFLSVIIRCCFSWLLFPGRKTHEVYCSVRTYLMAGEMSQCVVQGDDVTSILSTRIVEDQLPQIVSDFHMCAISPLPIYERKSTGSGPIRSRSQIRFSAQRRFIATEGQRAGIKNKVRRQRKREPGKGTRQRG